MSSTAPALVRVSTDQTFATDVDQARGLVLVKFAAPWCAPCRAVAGTVEQLAATYRGRLQVLEINTDTDMQVASRFSVRSLPTFLFMKAGQVVDQHVGAVSSALLNQKVLAHLE